LQTFHIIPFIVEESPLHKTDCRDVLSPTDGCSDIAFFPCETTHGGFAKEYEGRIYGEAIIFSAGKHYQRNRYFIAHLLLF